MKLGQILQGQMAHGQMSPRQLPANTDDRNNQPSKFGWFPISNIKELTSFVFIKYRDPNKNNTKIKFANPLVDIAASS